MGQGGLEVEPGGQGADDARQGGRGRNGPDTSIGRPVLPLRPNGDIFVSDGHALNQHNNARVDEVCERRPALSRPGDTRERAWRLRTNRMTFSSVAPRAVCTSPTAGQSIQVFDQDGKFIVAWNAFGQPSSVFVEKTTPFM